MINSIISATAHLLILATVFSASCASDQEKANEEYREYKVYRSKIGYDIIMRLYNEGLSKWGVPYQETDVDTTYGKTHVVISGLTNTKPLVLIHSFSSNSSWNWMNNMKNLSRDRRVYAVDVIGDAGKSKPVKFPKNHKDYADWLNEVFWHWVSARHRSWETQGEVLLHTGSNITIRKKSRKWFYCRMHT